MRVRVVILMMVLTALAACQRDERATVTGGYGTSVLSGVVVMGDGGTPAGVNVTVKGTGMAAVLSGDGRFTFAGAPEQAELLFDRAADGISASLQVESNAGPVVVELAQSGAKKSGRRRAAGRGKAAEFEGLVRRASATDVVVFTSKKVEQTIAITPETVIRRGQTILTPADLLVDTRVHVKAVRTDTGFSANQIIVQGGEADESPEGPARKEFEGIVISSGAAQLVMTDSHGVAQTFILDASTEIRKGKRTVLATEIQPGWRVHVKAITNADGTKTARQVIVQNTGDGDDGDGGEERKVKFGGRVTAVGATTLTVETDGGPVTVRTDASTAVTKGGSPVALSAIVAGDKVKVEGTRVDAATVLATKIEVR